MGLEVEALHGFVGHSLSLGIGRSVDGGVDLQTFRGCGVTDQIDDNREALEGFAPPVLCNMTEHAMLNLVPLAGAWWQMPDLQGETSFVGESLERHLPQANPVAVATTTIRSDQQARGFGIDGLSHLLPPAADTFDRELRCVVINSDADPALIGSQIVDAIGRGFAQERVDEIMHAHGDRRFLLLPLLPGVLEIAHHSFFFVSTLITG